MCKEPQFESRAESRRALICLQRLAGDEFANVLAMFYVQANVRSESDLCMTRSLLLIASPRPPRVEYVRTPRALLIYRTRRRDANVLDGLKSRPRPNPSRLVRD